MRAPARAHRWKTTLPSCWPAAQRRRSKARDQHVQALAQRYEERTRRRLGVRWPADRIPHVRRRDARETHRRPRTSTAPTWRGSSPATAASADTEDPVENAPSASAPTSQLYDLRVLDDDGKGDEFTVMAALQFVRYLNSHQRLHGRARREHEPVDPARRRQLRLRPHAGLRGGERVVAAGIVVVAAAGQPGLSPVPDRRAAHQDEAYNSISITDPGNADRRHHRRAPRTATGRTPTASATSPAADRPATGG